MVEATTISLAAPTMAQSAFQSFLERWGPYVSNRQWGTVREMYNLGPKNQGKFADEAWGNLSYEESLSTAYQFGEDGIFGLSDKDQYLCFSLAFWNHQDEHIDGDFDIHIKERFFGLPGLFGDSEGNLGEDIKELFYYLDNTPDHSYMRALYKYPCSRYPYKMLRDCKEYKTKEKEEFELIDTRCLEEGKYFDIFIEYAKDEESGSIYMLIHIQNRSNETCELTIAPTLWFRNVWEWGSKTAKPRLTRGHESGSIPRAQIKAEYPTDENSVYGDPCFLWGASRDSAPPDEVLFTENQTDPETRQKKGDNDKYRHVQLPFLTKEGGKERMANKASISRHITHKDANPLTAKEGTKSALVFHQVLRPIKDANGDVESTSSWEIYLRLYVDGQNPNDDLKFNSIEYCNSVIRSKREAASGLYCFPPRLGSDSEDQAIYRQAIATLLWNKQFYHFNVVKWMLYRQLFEHEVETEKIAQNAGLIPKHLEDVRVNKDLNTNWRHVAGSKIMVMPDKWEYPYFCTWDSAFHAVTMSLVDIPMAQQLLRDLVEKDCMNAYGQMPGCEFEFSDVHPPIHAWAVLKVYEAALKKPNHQATALPFLEDMVWKLWQNFVWWKDRQKITRHHFDDRLKQETADTTHHFYRGGFLGLDNISVVNRNHFKEKTAYVEQVDSAAWLACLALHLLEILVKLCENCEENHSYQTMTKKCLDTFLMLANTLNNIENSYLPSWDENDAWYYDILRLELKSIKLELPIRVRSLIGIIPLFATSVITGKKSNPVIQLISEKYQKYMGSLGDDKERNNREKHVFLDGDEWEEANARKTNMA